ncbi:MAG: polyribonucleotide nucleotidyltransferase [Planctomycetaceae bacterium]|nr:polyribonucleotide nucleotidyltransferase [Planctomycetaceae bacterium]MBT6158230.1 polyribonucleotide nucleotidyltransferase [Planctomycetaceae bacterium]MBT6485766.1 polyribonucleotide nucleotidyltransferase [Planctomycetaceae bacterium]MBT6494361.1 polyribonucleotide nucleotidyltransferase [Planctomycetaceae bacterium]
MTGLCSAFAASTVGCGTVLHPERRGQAAGPLDWKIVALDAIGLLFFFVPGVVAFAVDFSNGTIYLPSESYGKADAQPNSPELREVSIPSAELSQSRIQDVVTEHVGREVQLSPGEYETRELQNIGEFWETNQSLAAL